MLGMWQQRSHVKVFIISCIATCALVRGAFLLWTTPQKITVLCDAHINTTMCEQLTQWCNEHSEVLHEPQQLVDAFAWIRSCNVRFTSPKHATVCIKAYAPCAVVNNELVLLADGTVVDKDLYCSQALPEAQVTVAHNALENKQQLHILAQSVSAMEPLLFHEYYFSWDNATRCTVTEKQQGAVIVADHITMRDSKKISTGLALVTRGHVADIRFDKQVILRQSKPTIMLGVNDA